MAGVMTHVGRNKPAVEAYILIQVQVGKKAEVAQDVAAIQGVKVAVDVTGPYDVIARAEARSIDELGKLVVTKIQMIEGSQEPSRARSSTSKVASSYGCQARTRLLKCEIASGPAGPPQR